MEITVDLPEHVLEQMIEHERERIERMENVLDAFEENGLETMGGHYDRLKEDMQAHINEMDDLERQIQNQRDSDLSDLFG